MNEGDYFQPGKGVLAFCHPNSNKIGYYKLDKLAKSSTLGRELYEEWEMQVKMSGWTQAVVTPNGAIYAVNIKQTKY